MAGTYSDLYEGGNTSGYHTFKTDTLMNALNALSGDYEFQTHFDHPDGEILSVEKRGAASPIIESVLLHRNGRAGSRDIVLDTLVVNIDQLKNLARNQQTAVASAEHMPGGVIGRT